MDLDIRPIKTIEEANHVEDLVQKAWGTDDRMIIPDHFTLTIAKERGGVGLIAWDGERPVGFCLGFLAFERDGKGLKHCSHVTGVIPQARGNRVGEQIKWAQRDAVLALGLDHITWTYDPLETLNARLNIHKLGAVCNTFVRNLYGNGRDSLNWGVPTDRFQVDWWIDSPWVAAHRDETVPRNSAAEWMQKGAPVANPPALRDNLLRPGAIDESALEDDCALVAVPRNYQQLKQADMALGRAWREHTRLLFEQAFAAGFYVTDLLVEPDRCYYLLTRDFSPQTV